jgi:hypothetical protein
MFNFVSEHAAAAVSKNKNPEKKFLLLELALAFNVLCVSEKKGLSGYFTRTKVE